MIEIILAIILITILCIIYYRKGVSHTLDKVKNAINDYVTSHENMKELFDPGIEIAKHIIDQLQDKNKIW